MGLEKPQCSFGVSRTISVFVDLCLEWTKLEVGNLEFIVFIDRFYRNFNRLPQKSTHNYGFFYLNSDYLVSNFELKIPHFFYGLFKYNKSN